MHRATIGLTYSAMQRIWQTFLFGMLGLIGGALAPAWAQQDATQDWPQADRTMLTQIEAYLNALTTVRAGFVQTNADGTLDSGIMWISRPGRARIEYAPPTEVLLVADGTWLVYFDADLNQVSHIPIDTGPFRFLLADVMTFDESVKVTAISRGNGLARVTLVDPKNPHDGQVTLVFDESPLALRQWEVIDPQGYLTVVTLTDEVTGERFDDRMFYFPTNPGARQRNFRIGQHQ